MSWKCFASLFTLTDWVTLHIFMVGLLKYATTKSVINLSSFGWSICIVTGESLNNPYRDFIEETQEEDLELPLFSLETLSTATDEFSFRNKIGQGGFGPVYKVISSWEYWNYYNVETKGTENIKFGRMKLCISFCLIGLLSFDMTFS